MDFARLCIESRISGSASSLAISIMPGGLVVSKSGARVEAEQTPSVSLIDRLAGLHSSRSAQLYELFATSCFWICSIAVRASSSWVSF
jgi:hypothetical protein